MLPAVTSAQESMGIANHPGLADCASAPQQEDCQWSDAKIAGSSQQLLGKNRASRTDTFAALACVGIGHKHHVWCGQSPQNAAQLRNPEVLIALCKEPTLLFLVTLCFCALLTSFTREKVHELLFGTTTGLSWTKNRLTRE